MFPFIRRLFLSKESGDGQLSIGESLPKGERFDRTFSDIVERVLIRENMELFQISSGEDSFIVLSHTGGVPTQVLNTIAKEFEGIHQSLLHDGCMYVARHFYDQGSAQTIIRGSGNMRIPVIPHYLPILRNQGDYFIVDITAHRPFSYATYSVQRAFIIHMHDKELVIRVAQDVYGGQWGELSTEEIAKINILNYARFHPGWRS